MSCFNVSTRFFCLTNFKLPDINQPLLVKINKILNAVNSKKKQLKIILHILSCFAPNSQENG